MDHISAIEMNHRLPLFSALPCKTFYRIMDFTGNEIRCLNNFESTCKTAKAYVERYRIHNYNQSLPLFSLPVELFYDIFDFLGGEMSTLLGFEYTCKAAVAFLKGYHIPQRVLLTPGLQSWLEKTGALLGPNVTIANRPVLALLVSEDKRFLITIESFDSELKFFIWDAQLYKICRVVRGSTSVATGAFSEFHLLPNWRILGLRAEDSSRKTLELTPTLCVWDIHPSVSDCAYQYEIPGITWDCCFAVCVDFCHNLIIGIGGDVRMDDLSDRREWIILKDEEFDVCTEDKVDDFDTRMSKFEVIWSERVDVRIKHAKRLRDGRIFGYDSNMGYNEIVFHFSLWELQLSDASLKLIAFRSFSGADICNYHITCSMPMTTTAGYFATGHKNGEIYIWNYDDGDENGFTHRLMRDNMIQKNGVSHIVELPNGGIISSGFNKDKFIKLNYEGENIRRILIHSKYIVDFIVLSEPARKQISSMSNVRLVSAGEDRVLNFTSMDDMRVKVIREEKLPRFFSNKSLFSRSLVQLGV